MQSIFISHALRCKCTNKFKNLNSGSYCVITASTVIARVTLALSTLFSHDPSRKACTSVSDIVGLASQFATLNCPGCYSKLNLNSEFHAEVATNLPHLKLRTLYTSKIILL